MHVQNRCQGTIDPSDHGVDLTAMMGLVVEEVRGEYRDRVAELATFIVHIRDSAGCEIGAGLRKEPLDPCVLCGTRTDQIIELVVENRVEPRRRNGFTRKPRQPDSVTDQDVVQRPMD